MGISTELFKLLLSLLAEEDQDLLELGDAVFFERSGEFESEVGSILMVEHPCVQLAGKKLNHVQGARLEVFASFCRDQEFFLGNSNEFDYAVKDELQELVVQALLSQHD
jgi:hypothetical protein